MISGITSRQCDLLECVIAYSDAHGEAPSYREIAARLQLASPSGVVRMVDGLVARGYLSRGLPGHSRSLIVLKPPPRLYQRMAEHIARQAWCAADAETVRQALVSGAQ